MAKNVKCVGTVVVSGVRKTPTVNLIWHVRLDDDGFRYIRERKVVKGFRVENYYSQEFPGGEFMQGKTGVGLAYATAIGMIQAGYSDVKVWDFATGKVLKDNFSKGDVTRTVNVLTRIEQRLLRDEKSEQKAA